MPIITLPTPTLSQFLRKQGVLDAGVNATLQLGGSMIAPMVSLSIGNGGCSDTDRPYPHKTFTIGLFRSPIISGYIHSETVHIYPFIPKLVYYFSLHQAFTSSSHQVIHDRRCYHQCPQMPKHLSLIWTSAEYYDLHRAAAARCETCFVCRWTLLFIAHVRP